ncbi:glucoamylase family protein [Gelidibacter pelagius]|uniref:Beta-glucosidase n=1 Tax=Gelidibacter pelagius TaxID=2819985 RepID=A0ABS3SPZ7_9FLAO|nr:glucoamylase family protein [Gelidibacter pelagius]MBO3097782.1 beta-glucosidase [Gelidibacter pelagius]
MKKIYGLLFIALITLACSKSTPSEPFNPDPVDDGPVLIDPLTDVEMMDLVQRETFKYFWDFAEPNSKAAKERYIPSNPSQDQHVVTSGGTGFGLMAIIVGIERGYVTRAEAVTRLQTLLTFLENADRFHGAWSHWINGNNGSVIPFSNQDNGGDLVETSFVVQGLICIKEYFKNGSPAEVELANKADVLWKGVEWDWYTKNENVLYWHWSPNYDFSMNLKIQGYNESLITYVLAAASPDYSISPDVYTQGWAGNGTMVSSNVQYGLPLVLKHAGSPQFGGPMFFSHYSFLGLNPMNLADQYANYKDVVTNHAKINYQYAVQNPQNFEGYGKDCWGLSASYSRNTDGSLGYAAHSPVNDKGVISPTAAISSIAYTPTESLRAMHYFYQKKNKLLGKAGFYDAFSPEYDFWVAEAYLAIDQGPQIIMIENHRTGLLWNLFMQNDDVKNGLDKLGFTY